MSIASFFKSLFASEVEPANHQEIFMPIWIDGRVKHPWLLKQTENAKKVGKYTIHPPQDMSPTRAQIMINTRFYKMVGGGNFSTSRQYTRRGYHIQVVVRAVKP